MQVFTNKHQSMNYMSSVIWLTFTTWLTASCSHISSIFVLSTHLKRGVTVTFWNVSSFSLPNNKSQYARVYKCSGHESFDRFNRITCLKWNHLIQNVTETSRFVSCHTLSSKLTHAIRSFSGASPLGLHRARWCQELLLHTVIFFCLLCFILDGLPQRRMTSPASLCDDHVCSNAMKQL